MDLPAASRLLASHIEIPPRIEIRHHGRRVGGILPAGDVTTLDVARVVARDKFMLCHGARRGDKGKEGEYEGRGKLHVYMD